MGSDMPNRFSVEEIVLVFLNFSHYDLEGQTGGGEGESSKTASSSKSNEDEFSIDFKCGSDFDKTDNLLRMVLEVHLKHKLSGFVLEAGMGGTFKFEAHPDKKTFDLLSNVNCPAIIFPYLRELVSDITKRAGLEPFYIQPFNFVEAYKHRKKKEQTDS